MINITTGGHPSMSPEERLEGVVAGAPEIAVPSSSSQCGLIDEGALEPPIGVQFVLGVLGAADTSIETLVAVHQAAQRILDDDIGSLGVAAVGYPAELRHAAVAMALGLDIWVGLADNLRVRRGPLAESNADLVAVVSQLGDLLGRPPMPPDEFRSTLGPWFSHPSGS